jgi:hypothetical protein
MIIPAVLPAGTLVSFVSTLIAKKALEARVIRFVADDQIYQVIDSLDCVWDVPGEALTVIALPTLNQRIASARRRDSHSAEYMALRIWDQARLMPDPVDHLRYALALASSNGADPVILNEAIANFSEQQ